MSKSYDNLREDFIFNRDEKEYRHAYAEQSLDLSVGTQIKVLREQRGWRQEDLALEGQMRQPMVSRYENVNYSNWSINTLKKLARAFDVWLDVRFRSFGELVTTTEDFSRESLQVPKFADDSYFWQTSRRSVRRRRRINRAAQRTKSTIAMPQIPAANLSFQFEPAVAQKRLAEVISIFAARTGSVSITAPSVVTGELKGMQAYGG
jgi:transcriptional regulator with XRE-family HTH domain